jgi:hypothetical protein
LTSPISGDGFASHHRSPPAVAPLKIVKTRFRYDVQIDNISEATWNELLPQFLDSSLNSTWSVGSSQRGAKDLSHLILRSNGDVLGMAQVRIWRPPLLPAGIATIYWGPLWRRLDVPADVSILDALVRALKTEYCRKRGLLLRIWPVAFEGVDGALETLAILEAHGFVRNRSIRPYRTLLLNLEPTLEELRRNLSHKWRNQLNTAEKRELQLAESTTDEMYAAFLNMLNETTKRKQFTANASCTRYGLFQSDLPDHLKMKIILCTNNGEPVSGAVFSAIGATGVYVFGATPSRGLGLNGSNLIHWRTIEWLKSRRCQWYDLGGIDPKCNPGVYHFKRGIAGQKGRDVFHLGQFYVASNRMSLAMNGCLDQLNRARTFCRTGRLAGLGIFSRSNCRSCDRGRGHRP